MGVRIVVHEAETIGQALRRFNKELERSGTIREVRRHSDPTDRTQERRAKRFQKRFHAREATYLDQRAGIQPVASLAEALKQLWRRTGKP